MHTYPLPQTKHSPATMYPSYKGLIMAGYQGWFHSPGEGKLLHPDHPELPGFLWLKEVRFVIGGWQ